MKSLRNQSRSLVRLVAPAAGFSTKVSGDATGWVMNKVGITLNDTQRIVDVKNELLAQTKTLQGLRTSLDSMKAQLKSIEDRVLEAIEDVNERGKFLSSVAKLWQSVDTISSLSSLLRFWSQEEPEHAHAADVKDFRDSIFRNVPKAVWAIHSTLIGTEFNGMLELYARMLFKQSSTVEEFAQDFSLVFNYYYTYQISALQLMFEAYHSEWILNIEVILDYYEIWRQMVDSQIDQYRKFAPQTRAVGSRHVDLDRDVESLVVAKDPVYYLTQTGTIQATDLDGSNRTRTATDGLFHGSYPLLRIFHDALYVGGCEDLTCRSGYQVRRFDLNLNILGNSTIPPFSSTRQWSPFIGSDVVKTLAYPRGFDIVGSLLYFLQCPDDKFMQACRVGVFDLPSMTHQPQDFFSLPSTVPSCIGDIKVVVPGVAGIGDVGATYAQGVVVMDVTNHRPLAILSTPKSCYETSSGAVLTYRRDPSKDRRMYVQVQRVSSETQPQCLVLDGHPDGSSGWSTAPRTGTLVYGTTGGAYAAGGDVTLVGRTAILQLPSESLQGATTVMLSDDDGYLYKAETPSGTIVRYDTAYPFQHAPSLN